MPTTSFDVIVLGLGGMGSAACAELARRGRRVLGLEQFALDHTLGSSHGQTRIIRTAYFEHPDYVPLLKRAWERWYELEATVGRHLLTECGCLNIGMADGEIVPGVCRSADKYGLAVDRLDAAELRKRYPQFRFGDEYLATYEHQAGFLHVESCVQAHLDVARSHGAELDTNERVLKWHAESGHVEVTTARAVYRAQKLVITAGAWAGRLLAENGTRLRVVRQVPMWFETSDNRAFLRDRFPVFIAEVPGAYFYGFPVIDERGFKVAQHFGAPECMSPDEIDREPRSADEVPVRDFLNAHLPSASGRLKQAQTCLYTASPDHHFIIDVHPQHANVSFACGFSGHGFKFASVVGEIMADLAETGQTPHPIGMFRLGRFVA